jgi:hypothetical protein
VSDRSGDTDIAIAFAGPATAIADGDIDITESATVPGDGDIAITG